MLNQAPFTSDAAHEMHESQKVLNQSTFAAWGRLEAPFVSAQPAQPRAHCPFALLLPEESPSVSDSFSGGFKRRREDKLPIPQAFENVFLAKATEAREYTPSRKRRHAQGNRGLQED